MCYQYSIGQIVGVCVAGPIADILGRRGGMVRIKIFHITVS